MIRYFLQLLGLENVDDFALTAAEAAVAAMLLRVLVLPFLKKTSFWERVPKSLQLVLVAFFASLGAALDHFAGGNETRSSVLTGILAFVGALGLEKGEKVLLKKQVSEEKAIEASDTGVEKDAH